MARAVRAAAVAHRRYRAVSSRHTRRELNEATRVQRRAIKEARTRGWRLAVARASKNPKDIWRLQRWARLRSHTPHEPATMPALRRSENAPLSASTHAEKAQVLAARFFPNIEADLSDI